MESPDLFLSHVEALINRKSVHTDDEMISACISYCEEIISGVLDGHLVTRDDVGNLIAQPKKFSRSRPHLYLNAHVDTVDADGLNWHETDDPFTTLRTPTHLVGRGANDCKAGVSLMLTLAETLGSNGIGENISYLFSFREEGNKRKTAAEFGRRFGTEITSSEHSNYFLCLENTISIEQDKVTVTAYDTEPCNVFVEVEANISKIGMILDSHSGWNVVAIEPTEGDQGKFQWDLEKRFDAGHSATLRSLENPIYNEIVCQRENPFAVIKAGAFTDTSVVRGPLLCGKSAASAQHRALLNLRTADNPADIIEHLDIECWRPFYPLGFGEGSDRSKSTFTKQVVKTLSACCRAAKVNFKLEPNPGRSDASAIWNAMSEDKKNVSGVLVCGPGSRSHSDGGIMRRTHGENEGLHIEAAVLACGVIESLIEELCSLDANIHT